jgi:RecA-family ATPase
MAECLTTEKSPWRRRLFTAAELRRKTFQPVRWIVPGFLPEGLSLLAGRPKIGKSWLALEISLGVAEGASILGDITPSSGDVLYLALEDNPRRLQERTRRVFGDRPWPARCHFACDWPRLDKGGIDDLASWCTQAENPKLVIADTLATLRPERSQKDSLYDHDFRALRDLHQLANQRSLAVMALTHLRKESADDPLDLVSGSLGLTGAADTVMVLQRTAKGTEIYRRGRDVEESQLAVEFDPTHCRWLIRGDSTQVRRTDERKKILAALLQSAEPIGPSDIAKASAMSDVNVRQLLLKMVQAGEVIKSGRGRYLHPDHINHNDNKTEVMM